MIPNALPPSPSQPGYFPPAPTFEGGGQPVPPPVPQQSPMAISTPGMPAYRGGDLPLGATFDPSMFRARLKPGIMGLTPLTVAGLGIVAFCLVFLLIWLIFG